MKNWRITRVLMSMADTFLARRVTRSAAELAYCMVMALFPAIICIYDLLALILVQEGVGTLDFGTSVLWYLLVITLFFIGRWMFETENWLFVLLLSGCIGLAHYGVIWLMTRLQFIPLDTTQLLDESILQALLTPFVWQCSMMARRWVVPNENNTA